MLPAALALLVLSADAVPEERVPEERVPEERLDHRGAVGLIFGLSGMRKESSVGDNTWRGGVSVAGSINVGWRSNEILLLGCISMTRTELFDTMTMNRIYGFGVDGHLAGLFRGYFGDRWKTFVDLGAALNFSPGFTAGPRLGVGLQYELSSLAGVFATLGTFIGFGTSLMWRAELLVGVQLRSFLLE